jgi:TonB family protein
MFELKKFIPKFEPKLDRLPGPRSGVSREQEPKQRRMMLVALTLLVIAFGVVVYHDRNFWFPDTQESEGADAQPPETVPAETSSPTQAVIAKPASLAHEGRHRLKPRPSASTATHSSATHSSLVGASTSNSHAADPSANSPTPDSSATDASAGFTATTTRTVLPPLEVEVVAGDVHRTIHPGTNSVRVDLQPGSPTQPVSDAPATGAASDTAASVTSSAAERVQISADAAEVVSRPVKPGYPLLARQMKVQGSVILQALIGRDGLIQDLRVLSGPPILASAAQEAVKQWHFKPHYQGSDAVETQAKITVNFTISTN